jgi:hypothetical protein
MVHSTRKRTKEPVAKVLDFFLMAERDLGLPHLFELPTKCLDVALTVALGIIEHWRESSTEQFSVVHDGSSNLAKEKWMWDALVSPDVPQQLVGFDERITRFPLGVAKTTFADSTVHRQLQISDVLAGASATWAASLIYHAPKKRLQYCKDLEAAGIRKLLCGAIWPLPDVKRMKSHPEPNKLANPLDFFGDVITSARIRRNKDGD